MLTNPAEYDSMCYINYLIPRRTRQSRLNRAEGNEPGGKPMSMTKKDFKIAVNILHNTKREAYTYEEICNILCKIFSQTNENFKPQTFLDLCNQ